MSLPLTVEHAESVLLRTEEILFPKDGKKKPPKDVFVAFKQAGVESRLEAAQAIHVVFAHLWKLGKNTNRMEVVEKYTKHANSVLGRLFSGGRTDRVRPLGADSMWILADISSFVDFLKILPDNDNFWPKVYQRIGIPMLGGNPVVTVDPDRETSMQAVGAGFALFCRWRIGTCYRRRLLDVRCRWIGNQKTQ